MKLGLILLSFMTLSCAHKSVIKDRIDSKEITINSVADLARTSYLRGCVESKSKLSFEECTKKSKNHEKEIKEILK